MNSQPSDAWREDEPIEHPVGALDLGDDIPLMELQPYRDDAGRVVDPVDPAAAAFLAADDARAANLIPFAVGRHRLYVAAVFPLCSRSHEVLAGLTEMVGLYRADADDLRAAQDRIYGRADRVSRELFGRVAVASGKILPEDLDHALGQQKVHGGQLGSILASAGVITFRDAAQIAAQQAGLPFIDLLGEAGAGRAALRAIEPKLFDLMPERFWRLHNLVPVRRLADSVVLAVENPQDQVATHEVAEACGLRVHIVVTGHRDIAAALDLRYAPVYVAASRDALKELRPDDSAHRLLSAPQTIALAAVVGLTLVGLWFSVSDTLTVLNTVCVVAFVVMVGWRMWMMRRSAGGLLEVDVSEDEVAGLDERRLPVYTVLVPVRDEASVLPVLAQALREIDYPKDRLDVKLLVEEDDDETLAAAVAGRLPSYIEIVKVPRGRPRTKPRACNYGLFHARGQYVVIYDAEDIPEPDQLKKALVAFQKVGPEVACIQAKLSYFNRNQNLLTRWFTAEYAMWFDLLLPALHAARLPIPLGGTSNHLRTDVLRTLGGWDPYNVTEDADLGIRLHKAGHRTALVDSTTYEEANSDFVNWVRQRSRWVKGYIQTWFVHMRHPLRLWRELGPGGFVGFQMMVAGTPLIFLLNPIYWLLTTLWFLVAWGVAQQIFPSWVYYLGMINMLFGAFAFTYMNMAAVARRGYWELVPTTLLAPLYWGLMSLASMKALLQIVTRPSHWEKTTHGLADLSELLPRVGGVVDPAAVVHVSSGGR